MIKDNGIKSALKSSEVVRQAADFSEKKSAAAEADDLFNGLCEDKNIQASNIVPAESGQSGKQEALFNDTSVLGQDNRGPGRPKGAKNKSTREWVEYFLNQCSSPLIFLGKLMTEDTASLARRMCADRIDALKVQVGAANALLPYIHQKQPLAIENVGDELPTINIFTSRATFNQLNNGNNQLKKEIIVDGISSVAPEKISLENNKLIDCIVAESENKV